MSQIKLADAAIMALLLPLTKQVASMNSNRIFDASQMPNDGIAPSSPLPPGIWEIDNLERLLQNVSPSGVPDFCTNTLNAHQDGPHQHYPLPAMTSESDHDYLEPCAEYLPLSEQQDWSLEENMQGVHFCSSSQKDTSSQAEGQASAKSRPRRKQISATEKHSEWTKSKTPGEVYLYIQRLYKILNIGNESDDDQRERYKWARRFRQHANEKMSQDIKSNDPIRHQKAIEELSIRRNSKASDLHIGERRRLAERLNRYWQLDPRSAYNRFVRKSQENPEVVNMARSSDENVVKMAANLLRPRDYSMKNRGWKKLSGTLSDLQLASRSKDVAHEEDDPL